MEEGEDGGGRGMTGREERERWEGREEGRRGRRREKTREERRRQKQLITTDAQPWCTTVYQLMSIELLSTVPLPVLPIARLVSGSRNVLEQLIEHEVRNMGMEKQGH